jgi:hypothetical protein
VSRRQLSPPLSPSPVPMLDAPGKHVRGRVEVPVNEHCWASCGDLEEMVDEEIYCRYNCHATVIAPPVVESGDVMLPRSQL